MTGLDEWLSQAMLEQNPAYRLTPPPFCADAIANSGYYCRHFSCRGATEVPLIQVCYSDFGVLIHT